MRKSLTSLLIVFVLLSCGENENYQNTIEEDDFSSPKSLFVDYISSFTGGVMSSNDEIRVRLTKTMPDSLVGQTVTGLFRFSPTIEGASFWEDNRTLVFQPAERLQNGQRFEATLDLRNIIEDIDEDKEEFRFVFQTLVQNYEVLINGIKLYDATDLKRIKLEGTINTADGVPLDQVEKMLKASQNDKSLEISWLSTEASTYGFEVLDLERGDNPGMIKLVIDGAPIGVDRQENQQVPIPSLSDYKVLSSRVFRGNENYISVIFSDPIDPGQTLNGLVRFTGSNKLPRVVVNLNELRIYPTEELTGSVQLLVNAGIQNIAGFKLKEDYSTNLQFTQMKPQLQLVSDGQKSILPTTSGMMLPFKAAGLSAVDVTVIQIFDENVLQYLQVNRLGGSNQLNRVARPVIRKVVPLNKSGVTNLSSWNTFHLDIADLITAQPGSVYQIEIGFRKSQSLYFCSSEDNPEGDQLDEDWDQLEEDSYWDNSEYYYSSGYDWRERDNPCSDSYYGKRRSISKVLLASDLGIIAKGGEDAGYQIFVNDLSSTQPISGVEVTLYDFQQQPLASGSTSSEGAIQLETERKPFALVARKGEQVGYLRLDNGTSLSLSSFDVTGVRVSKGIKGFIYGERGVWRPADTVHLSFILEDHLQKLPATHPVVMELYNPNGQLRYRKVSSEPVGNIYRYDFVTDREAPTGFWQARAKVGGSTFSKPVRIETIKPNRLKIDLKFDKSVFSASDDFVTGDLNVRWLSGAVARNLRADYEMKLTPTKTRFSEFPNHNFDDFAKSFQSEREPVYSGRVDQNGNARISLNLGRLTNAPGALKVNLYGKVFEEGGDFSISTSSIPYYPFRSFVGIQTPEGDKRGMLLTDQDHSVSIATVASDGTPISRSGLIVELFKVNWRWWWDRSYDNISNYVNSSYREPVSREVVSTTDGRGTWQLRVNHPEWGRYYIRITDPSSGHSTGQVVYMDWPGWAGKGKRGDLDGASMLDFAVEKEEYTVGDQVKLSIPSTEGNRVLVSLETGSRTLETFWVQTKADKTVVSFEATPDMAPNVYAHLTMIQPYSQTANDLPIRLYGVQSIKVVDSETVLEPVINMPDELRPEQQFSISVSEKNGKPMAYTLAIVDEGLLDITNYKTPKPWDSFFAREALGIKTWDVYGDVLGAFGGAMDYLLAIGGDDEIEAKEEKDANRFKPVVKYLGPFELERGEEAVHQVRMPQYIGSVKTMVVAASEGRYGSADNVTQVKQPLMVLATLPRVAGPGEKMKLPVNVFALEDNVKKVEVSVQASGQLGIDGSSFRSVNFSTAGDKVIYFDIKAQEALGVGKVKVTAKSGNLETSYDIEINVIARNPVFTTVESKLIDQDAIWEVDYEPMGISGENTAYLEVSTFPSLNLEQRLGYLIRYPHGCIEQTTSAVFAQLYVNKLVDISTERQQQIQKNIDAGIKRMRLFQLSSGGFTYWPGNSYPNEWGTNYAGHFLVEAQEAGYAVPEGMLASWINYQIKKADSWGSNQSDSNDDLIQAYRLYTLAVAGSPALGAMNRMKENANIRPEARWRLASAYAVAGFKSQALSIIENIPEYTGSSTYSRTFGSRNRDKAMIMEAMIELDMMDDAFEILQPIAKDMGDPKNWMSTQTTAYCLIGVAAYASKIGDIGETNVEIMGDQQTETLRGSDYVYQFQLSAPDRSGKMSVSNKGTAPVYARLIRSGIPIEGTDQDYADNIEMKIRYQDMTGSAVNPDNLTQGQSFQAEVTVKNPGMRGIYEDVALTQIFPSGWEIVNTRLDGSADDVEADYIDIRDDRVMHYFDLEPRKTVTFKVLLNASYQGTYYLPATSVGTMYDNTIFASSKGRWITVLPQGQQ